ncbi:MULTISPECIES: hypothetical protein [Tatumella]|uniref:Fimbrial adhesin n=2 Tax=Tatumella ptyseos TaxID=82987 RepID=A0A085JEM6_9GAMM|nr:MULTISPECIES: hypothetical protein [Tatumella]KFD18922.1 hypothetical protein GTPT_2223 [Tatumella ptyseos ATCC 33301]SQK74922.1 Uncharacterised protein [Tatumella ptyseos]
MKIFRVGVSLFFLFFCLSSYSSDGTIQFTGYIYQSACGYDYHNSEFNCPKTIRPVATQALPQLTTATLPPDFGTSQMNWLNTTHSRGIMTLSYR